MPYKAIFDWKQTLYLPGSTERTKKSGELIQDGRELLEYLAEEGVECHLIGKGGEDMRQETRRLAVAQYFTSITFSPGEKRVEDFLQIVGAEAPEATFVIGDRVKGEIAIGNQVGATTIWVQQGRFAAETPESPVEDPDYIAGSLHQVQHVIDQVIQSHPSPTIS